MIIPGHAWLTLLSLPQEFQGTREEGGFGALLTAIEQHTAALPHQDEPERCAFECMLQVLMSIFQSCPVTNPLPMVSAPGTEESGLGSTQLAEGLLLGLPPDEGIAPALWDTAEVNLLPGMLANGVQDIAPLAFPALEDQSTGPSPVAAGAPLSATTPSVSRDSAEALFVNPGLQQTFLASNSESPATAGLRQPDLSQSPEITLTAPLMESAVATKTQLLAAGEPVFQHTSRASQPGPVGAAPAVPWAGHAAAPSVAQDSMPLPSSPQTAAATMGDAPVLMALVQENIALPEYDASPAPHHRPDSQEWVAETLPSVAPLTTDSALPLSSARTTSHLPSVAPAIAVPTSHSLEDSGRPWLLPMPPNTVVLHLEPRELGALLLRVRVHDKRLIASFQTQSPEAEILLRSHLPSLHESLSQHGFEVQPIAITRAAEGLSTHMEAGTGAFAHQHSAFQGFAEDWQAANASETQDEVDLQRAPRWLAEQRPRLLDVVI